MIFTLVLILTYPIGRFFYFILENYTKLQTVVLVPFVLWVFFHCTNHWKKASICERFSGERTSAGLLGPLLSNDKLNDARSPSPLTLSCRGETALCQRLGVSPFKQLPTFPLENPCVRLATSTGWERCKCLQRERKRGRERGRVHCSKLVPTVLLL